MKPSLAVFLVIVAGIMGGFLPVCAQEPPQATTAIDPSAEAILRQAAETAKSVTSLEAQISQKVKMHGRTVEQDITLAIVKPNRFYIEADGAMPGVACSNGERATYYCQVLDQAVKTDAPKNLQEEGLERLLGMVGTGQSYFVMMLFAEDPFTLMMEDVKTLEAGEVTEVNGEPCDVAVMDHHEAPYKIEIAVGRQSHMIRRLVVRAKPRGGREGFSMTEEVSQLRVDEPIPPERFVYEPPVTAKVVDEFDLSSMMPEAKDLTGRPAPDFTLSSLDGKKITLSDLRGKAVLLDFSATWCPPCRLLMPLIQKFHERWAEKDLVVLMINDEPVDTISKYLKDKGFTFTVLRDTDGEVSRLYGVRGIPRTIIIDREGKVALDHTGFGGDGSQLEEAIKKALGE